MNWWSLVTSANWLMRAWSISNHSPTPSSLPIDAWNSANAFSALVLMARTLQRSFTCVDRLAAGRRDSPPAPALLSLPEITRRTFQSGARADRVSQDRERVARDDALARIHVADTLQATAGAHAGFQGSERVGGGDAFAVVRIAARFAA